MDLQLDHLAWLGALVTLLTLMLLKRKVVSSPDLHRTIVRRNATVDAAAHLHELVARECPSCATEFCRPRDLWAGNPFVQSILLYSKLHKLRDHPSAPDATPALRHLTTRDLVACPDGGTVAIDWVSLEGCSPQPSDDGATPPVVIAFPGVGNCDPRSGFASMLLGALLERGRAAGQTPFVGSIVYPGFNGLALDSHKLPGTCYLATVDVGFVLRHVRRLHPHAPLVILATSIGSALVSNWAGRHPSEASELGIDLLLLYAYGHSAGTTACVADASFAGVSGRFVAAKWRAQMFDESRSFGRRNIAHLTALEKQVPGFSLARLRSARSVGEWDLACLPAYGIRSLAQLYAAADSAHYFEQLASVCPVVLFNADDDWLCSSDRIRALRKYLYDRMPNVLALATHGGGHLGWIEKTHKGELTGEHAEWVVGVTSELVGASASGKLKRSVQVLA
jgi:predicted alpha/beta-fold hydrolase